MDILLIKALKIVLSNTLPTNFKNVPIKVIKTLIVGIERKEIVEKNEAEILLKENGYSTLDLGWSVLKLLKENKLKWDDIALLQNKYKPNVGMDLIPSTWLARNIINYGLEDNLPRGSDLFKHSR